MKTFNEFYASHVNKSWDKYGKPHKITSPQVTEPFAGQCVSLIKTYLIYLFGDKVKNSYGDAIDYWRNRKVNGILDLCDEVKEPKSGDIIVTTADPDFGHIYIYKDGAAFTQNCLSNPRAVVYPLSYNGPIIGILRPKEIKPEFQPIEKAPERALYRLYNANNGDHVYTLDLDEANKLKRDGWTYEGVAWTTPETGTAVARLYKGGRHMYTSDDVEREALIADGWTLEKEDAFKTADKGKRVYRMSSKESGHHIWTTSKKEHDALTKSGWYCEGHPFKY